MYIGMKGMMGVKSMVSMISKDDEHGEQGWPAYLEEVLKNLIALHTYETRDVRPLLDGFSGELCLLLLQYSRM